MHTKRPDQPITRREALCRMGSGFGMLAFANMVGQSLLQTGALHAAPTAGARGAIAGGGTHFAPKAKHVIFLFMNGGVSQVDSFDPKPMLDTYHGQPMPGEQIATERRPARS